MDHDALVFASVFPVPSLSHTTPTPVATPDLASTAPATSFGSPHATNAGGTQNRHVRRNVAWSAATRFLSLSESSREPSERTERPRDVEDALNYLLVGEGTNHDDEEGIAEWFANEARLHFASYVRQDLLELWDKVRGSTTSQKSRIIY